MASPLSNIATEILDRILEFVKEPTIARFVCRRWNDLLLRHLFRQITLVPREGIESYTTLETGSEIYKSRPLDFSAWTGVLQNEKIRSIIRKISIQCHVLKVRGPDIDDAYQDFIRSLSRIKELPRLEGIQLFFSVAPDFNTQWDSHREMLWLTTLQSIIEFIKKRAECAGTSRIHQLALQGIQHYGLGDLAFSESVKSVMRDLDELHIGFVDRTISCLPPQERGPIESFLERYLGFPMAENLSTLSIHQREYWGGIPTPFDSTDLFFPNLKNLSLGNYVIVRHNQLEWLLRHTSLQSLQLQNCVILSYFVLSDDETMQCENSAHDWVRYPANAFGFAFLDSGIYHFPGTWENVLDKIRTRLPQLVDFRYGSRKPTDHNLHLDSKMALSKTLPTDRYVKYQFFLLNPYERASDEEEGRIAFGTNDPTPIHGNDRLGWEARNPPLDRSGETHDGDQRALNELLDVAEKRRIKAYLAE